MWVMIYEINDSIQQLDPPSDESDLANDTSS